ncbi:MAG: aspartate--tRNA ligase [Oscillospiraceae bacterium]|nr:aspartate--tRNA ligase [Oscillospiraceae bacterium]
MPSFNKNKYRTHTTSDISNNSIGEVVRVAGWVENIRDHGGVMFVDLRDYYGIVQVTMQSLQNESSMLLSLEGLRKEATVSISGEVVQRNQDTFNPKISTGEVEIVAKTLDVLGNVYENLPFEPASSRDVGEDVRLKYRFLDLRNRRMQNALILRSKVISEMRTIMDGMNFLEMQTPILSASSPEGARDFLVPSRRHKGKFFALPQAPQIFKQVLMTSGFDRYYQIAPCFRDEDARADRTAGEFYQLDFEMAFAEQEDVFKAGETVISQLVEKFSGLGGFEGCVPAKLGEIPRISFKEAMLKYGTDKPDLRNPLFIIDISEDFVNSDFKPFSNKVIRAIRVPHMARHEKASKSFFKNMEEFAVSIGMKGLGYVKVEKPENLGDGVGFDDSSGEKCCYAGPIDKFLTDESRKSICRKARLLVDDVLYFIAESDENVAAKNAGQIRTEVAKRLGVIADCGDIRFKACWITDFPFYEKEEGGERAGEPRFGHNPFSMPQGELEALNTKPPLEIVAYQYDFVLNGVELASGAVRNHNPDIMVKAFEIAGFSEDDVREKFGALYSAFRYGAPPHAGMAFGVDRLLMLLLNEENVRETIAFPLNSNAQDVLLGAPGEVSEMQLREAHIKIRQ